MSSEGPATPDEHLQSLLREGYALLSRGDIEGAGRCCQEVLAQRADLVPGHFLVGLVALEARERRTAFSAFQSVVRLDPDHAAAWAQLARMQRDHKLLERDVITIDLRMPDRLVVRTAPGAEPSAQSAHKGEET